MRLSALICWLLLPLAPTIAQQHAIQLELLQLAFGRSSLSYQFLAGPQLSTSLSAKTYLNFTDLARITTQQFKEILSQRQYFNLSTDYDLHFGLGFGLTYWPQQPLRSSFVGVEIQTSYQTYAIEIDATPYQGDALIVGSAMQGGYRWQWEAFILTLNAEIGLALPFALAQALPEILQSGYPYAALGLSIGVQWY